MQHAQERLVLFLDMKLSVIAGSNRSPVKGIKPAPLRQLMTMLADIRSRGEAELSRPNGAGTNTTYLQDMRMSATYAMLLINFSDSTEADPAFSYPMRKARRQFVKRPGEGNEYSAHVLVRFKPLSGKPETYEMLLEQSPGLNSSRVSNFLRFLIRTCEQKRADKFYVEHPDGSIEKDGNPKLVKVRHKVDVSGHLSPFFVQQLDEGKLLNVQLITEKMAGAPWDQHAYSREKQRTINIVPSPSVLANLWSTVLASIAERGADKQYEKARVAFRTKEGLTRSVVFDTASLGTADDNYVRKEKISGFTHKLGTSFEKIDPVIETKMVALSA